MDEIITRDEIIKSLQLKPLIRKMKLANHRHPKIHSDQTKKQIALAHWDRLILALETLTALEARDSEDFQSQAYQVIGNLLQHSGAFGSEAGERALDYFSGDEFDEDFLPWPREGESLSPPTPAKEG